MSENSNRLNEKLLRVYLHDHLAGAMGGVELARHLADQQAGSAYGPELAVLADDIEADRDALRAILGDLGLGEHAPHEAATWLGEKLARLKPNGELLTSSPLTLLIELETLVMGLEGKRSGWISLRRIAHADPRLDVARLDALIGRAMAQAETAERLRVLVAQSVLVEPSAG